MTSGRQTTIVSTVDELVEAAAGGRATEIVVRDSLHDVPGLALSPGASLRGAAGGGQVTLSFAAGADGVRLAADNRLADLRLEVSPDRRAVYNDTGVNDLGRIELVRLTTVGRVQILGRDAVRGGHVEVDGLDIMAADARGETERPQGYGVRVLQGAFTLWNMQPDADIVMTANLVGLSAGRLGRPVLGSGIFVAGGGDHGGRVLVQRLVTGAVYSDGRIAPGAPDQIAGGVFVVSGVRADVVRNRGPVTTYGVNDMALDNWGAVDRWSADAKVTTHGPSGIGFVNFGTVRALRVDAPIETFGPGARGFNVYTGTVDAAEFDRIITRGDGAVGVQIAQPIGRLIVRRGIKTFGGTGPSLVKGVVQTLSAVALSVKPGGSIRSAKIAGGLRTNGRGVAPLEQHGTIDALTVTDEFVAAGGW